MFKITDEYNKCQGIYMWKNLLNKDCYVGCTGINFRTRFKRHISSCKRGSKDCPYLYNAMRKYGIENFEFFILEIVNNITREELEDLEQKWADKLNPRYNVRKIVKSNAGYKHRKNAKSKLRGKYNIKSRPVTQYTLDGIKIRDFYSIHEASEFCKKHTIYKNCRTAISRCCNGLRFKAAESRWSYKNKEIKNFEKKRKIIKIFDKNNNTEIKFKYLTEVAIYLNVSISSVKQYIKKGFSTKHNVKIGVIK